MVNPKRSGWQLKQSEFVQYIKSHFSDRNSARFESAFFGFTGDSRQPNVQFGKIVIPYRQLSFKLRICPDCARSGYFEKNFHLQWIDTCPIHGCRYIEVCPQCGNPIDWIYLHYNLCRCGFDFLKAPSTPGDSELSKIFINHAARGDQLFFDRFIKTLKIVTHEHPHDIYKHQNINLSAKVAQGDSHELLNYLFARKKLFPSLNPMAYCSPWLCSADQFLSNVSAEFLSKLTEAYPEECALDCTCRTLQLTIRELCLAYKLSQSKMHKLIAEEKFTLTKNKRSKYYSCDSLCQSLNRRLNSFIKINNIMPSSTYLSDEYTSYRGAGEHLGTTSGQVALAVKYNLLSCYRIPPKLTRAISIAEIETFSKQYVFLSNLAKQLKLKPSVLSELFDFSGIRPFLILDTGNGETYHKFGAIYFKSETKAIAEFLASIRKHREHKIDRRGICYLSQQLNLGVWAVKKLLEYKLIEVELRDASGRKIVIDESQLDKAIEWRSNYFTLKELSQELGISGAELSRRFLPSNYSPAIRLANVILIHKTEAHRMRDHLSNFLSVHQAADLLNVTDSRIHSYLKTGALKAAHPSECGEIHDYILISRSKVEERVNMITSSPTLATPTTSPLHSAHH
jgi:hypothetical protein